MANPTSSATNGMDRTLSPTSGETRVVDPMPSTIVQLERNAEFRVRQPDDDAEHDRGNHRHVEPVRTVPANRCRFELLVVVCPSHLSPLRH